MAAPVNTGQLIYCSELILAHQKTFTELTSLIMIGMKLKIIKALIYVKTSFNLCFFLTGLACVASVSVRFTRSKEWGTRVKDRAKNDASKRAGRGWGRKKETLADNRSILKTAYLVCHAWVRAPAFDAVISCHKFVLPWSGNELWRRVCETKIIFFCILERVDGVNGEISMNPNDQCRSKLS